ncbi:restriction endonuclease subunit S [Treponema sp.]|uniref:restriction endonuclease subunit S n=1 Tax=Treponema sp. TaxID=166 RepID=UPI00388E9B37
MELQKHKLNDFLDGYGDGLHGTPAYSDDGTYFFINGNNLENNGIQITSDTLRISEDEYQKIKRPLTNNTILLSINGTLGKLAFYKGEKIALGKSACFLNIRNDVDKRYIKYVLSSKEFKKYMLTVASGSTIKNFAPKQAAEYEFFAPDLPTQKKIADVLSCIDDKIALNNKTNTELENMAKTIYDYWFTQFDFPDKNGHPYKTSGGQMVYNETLKREIPAGWEVGKLSDIANITMGQSPDGESYNEDGNGTIFYQGSTDFGNRSPSIRVYTTAPTRFAKKNDILMSVRAPVGTLNIANTDCCIGRGLAALNSKTNSISYLYCVMRNFQRQFEVLDSIGTTFGSITKDDLFGLQVIIPPKEIIEDFCKIGNEIFKEQSRIDEENEELTKLRDYLLPLLMNGQIEVI